MKLFKIQKNFRHWSVNLSRAFGSSTPWIFLFGATGLGLLSEGIAKVIDLCFPNNEFISSWSTFVLGLLIIILVIAAFDLPHMLNKWLSSRSQQETNIEVAEVVPKKRALIVLVSRGPDPAAAMAMRHHFSNGLSGSQEGKYCWLITGPDIDEMSSQENAKKLKAEFEGLGVSVKVRSIDNADNPRAVFEEIQYILQMAQIEGLKPEDIIADFTGGTKCMTAGMVLAFADKDLLLQYMKPNKYDDYGRSIREAGSTPHLVDVDFFARGRA
jgi:hypothetical protein